MTTVEPKPKTEKPAKRKVRRNYQQTLRELETFCRISADVYSRFTNATGEHPELVREFEIRREMLLLILTKLEGAK